MSDPKKILVTGGAGYIGSHTVSVLKESGYMPVVFDNFSQGHKTAVSCKTIQGDLKNKSDIVDVLSSDSFSGVIHFAAFALAGESMKQPGEYFKNNILGGVNLLDAMKETDVNAIVFSSTCAIYGFPDELPVTELAPQNPVSVYGESKKMFEKILDWYDQLFAITSVRLRYFNASGAALDGSNGEWHEPETHILPIAIEVAAGKRDHFTIFGDDYNTKDGTNVRDYIHVLDLADAHIKALEYIWKKNKSNAFNLGTGKGYSNKEILDMVKTVSRKEVPVVVGPRREGDPDAIFADNTKAKSELGWKPKYSDLKTIVESAWKWQSTHPNGFEKK